MNLRLVEAWRTSNFGPWATAIDAQPAAGLSAFWKRRMSLLPSLRPQSPTTPLARLGVALTGLVLLGLPLVNISRRAAVADETKVAGSPDVKAASHPTNEYLPVDTEAEKKILAALDHVTEMEFNEAPLQDVIDYFKDLHNIEIQLDIKPLEESGVGSDTPVSGVLKGMPLRSALSILLKRHDMAWMLRDEVLQITTPDVADSHLTTRIYPVADLVEDGDYQSLTEAIINTVAPASWNEGGGPGSLAIAKGSQSLVISQTGPRHEEILSLLRGLRKARADQGPPPPRAKPAKDDAPTKRPSGGGRKRAQGKGGGMGMM